MVARLVVIDADDSAFVDRLQRAWDDGDAVLPLDHRLPTAARRQAIAAARPDEPVEPGDALVMITSGTTGAPKAAVLTHDAVRASAEATSARLAVDPTRDRWLACLPLSHVGGLSVITRSLLTGTPLTLHGRFDAKAVEAAATEGCTLTSVVPTALARIDPDGFRAILVGGQAPPTNPPPNVIATYGMTETGSGVVYDGVPLDGVELRLDSDGEIAIRAPMCLRTYRDGTDPKASDGWLPTGDLGDLIDGHLVVHGRRGDLIITGGENVWPAAVEAALVTHPAISEVVVSGQADPEWGQRVVATIVPVDPAAPPSLVDVRAWAQETLPRHAAPRELIVTDRLPRTSSGKVRRGDVSRS